MFLNVQKHLKVPLPMKLPVSMRLCTVGPLHEGPTLSTHIKTISLQLNPIQELLCMNKFNLSL